MHDIVKIVIIICGTVMILYGLTLIIMFTLMNRHFKKCKIEKEKFSNIKQPNFKKPKRPGENNL